MQKAYAKKVECCCCSARSGLRCLGWWWLVECLLSLAYIWLPVLWVMTGVELITYTPCFYAFLKLRASSDSRADRELLYRFYLYFGVGFGLPAYFFVYLYVYLDFWRITHFFCIRFGDPNFKDECITGFDGSFLWILISAIVGTLLQAIFRLYFLSVMKAYWREAEADLEDSAILNIDGQEQGGNPHLLNSTKDLDTTDD